MEPYKPKKMTFDYSLSPSIFKLLCETEEIYGEYKGFLKSMSFDYKYLVESLLKIEILYSSIIDGSKNTKEDIFYFPYMIKTNNVIKQNNLVDTFMYGISETSKNGFSLDMINKMNKLLFKESKKDSHTKGSGHLRKTQTYILKPGLAGSSVSFIPPVYSDLNTYMKNLCEYLNESKENSFISTALMHYQFEKLHPYVSSNGMLGRILIPIKTSVDKKEAPILFISQSIDHLKNTYFSLLSAEEDSLEKFVKLMLECIYEQCSTNIKMIKKLNKVYNTDIEAFKTVIGGSSIYKIYPFIIKRIVFTTADIVNDTGLHINSVNKVLNKLVESGYLHKEKRSNTNRVTFRYDNMFNILTM